MKKIIFIALAAIIAISMLVLVSCDEKEPAAPVPEYNVIFESNGGTEYEDILSKGQKIELPTPSRDGFTFDGWYISSDLSGDKLEGIFLPASDTTLYAKWTPINTYTIKFNTRGAEPINDMEVYKAITLPTPSRSNAYFIGWYDNPGYTGEPLGETYMPTADVTLYALWSEKNPDPVLYFKSNGGTKYVELHTKRSPVELPTPEKEYFNFEGWYLEADFSGERLADVISLENDMTIYAKWSKKDGVTEVIFSTDGQTTHNPGYSVGGSTIELPTPSNYGYKFLGWYDGDNKVESPYKPTKDTTLTAKWEKVTYVYVYYGLTSDYVRYELKKGDTFSIEDIDEKCKESIYEGEVECPFLGLSYENGKAFDSETVVGDDHLILVAKYDVSARPILTRFEEKLGGLLCTAKGVANLVLPDSAVGVISADLYVEKGASGGAGICVRQTLNGYDYPHEQAGNEYIAAVLVPSNGSIQMSRVKDGKWTAIATIALGSLSKNWQNKFNAAASGELMLVSVAVKNYENKFEVYIDGELQYTCADASILSLFTGKGFGIRSTTVGALFVNFNYSEDVNAELPLVSPIKEQ